eukprot:CAMPEP_0113417344 /NCGR_PEP_ID=MMETSP0013_2-20120614/25599_1 /TAXON_ID=2843 ORGANISM="Skeletonema costatum, Strain 1716" /NCGR_SAMPLE_ID=MMETSP0013_2 /ASSEMBLY_ACC=CAM_ASM_000158 /LENGTH=448 /DNA_ID=CAMNT_0000304459 /DNA_START=18 /DNA_END=1364 /DNA_ORIENTATION=+ /assembly_acc=CAM_ASM_000158
MSSTAGSVGTASDTAPPLTPTNTSGDAAPPSADGDTNNPSSSTQQPSTPTGITATSTEDTNTPADSFLFASESVTESHPDKLCDTISDAIVDACLTLDPSSRVACETVCKTGVVIIFGEITTSASINYEQVIRDAVRDAGYDDPAKGLDYKTCNVIVALEEQSPDIAQSVDSTKVEDMGAGDSSVVFGYACEETPEFMPMSHSLATKLSARLAAVRKDGTLDWIRPDGKTQVTMEYVMNNDGVPTPKRVHSIIISAQHAEEVSNDKISADLLEHVVKPVVPEKYLDDKTIYHMNPSGRFVIGGPHSDAGLTGRKPIVDSYGGWGSYGGGTLSGKDATKVDRSGAYAARWIAKSLVAAGYCHRCCVQLSYAIGLAQPISVHVDTYGTCTNKNGQTEQSLAKLVETKFDLRPGCIVKELDLRRPIMRKTAAYGHFGREEEEFKWEKVKDI